MCTGKTLAEVGATTAMEVGITSIHPLRGNKVRRDCRMVREPLPRSQLVRDFRPSIRIHCKDSTDLRRFGNEANSRPNDYKTFIVVGAVFAGRHQRRSSAFS